VNRLSKIFQFMSWPVVCGVLLAIVILQYQQLRELQELRLLPTTNPTASAPIPATTSLSFADAIKIAAPSVVSIHATSWNVESIESIVDDKVNFNLEARASLGSGVIISEMGFVLTNLHVVDTLPLLDFDTEVTLQDGRSTPATVIAWDKANDLAVLHINMDNLSPIQVGDDSDLEVGDLVFAIGYPRNIGQSVSQGIVSALTNTLSSDGSGTTLSIIQTDAAINPGNSGGALIDSEGKLVGINSSIFSESGNFEGIGFATPVSLAVTAMEEMVEQAIAANSGYLGVIAGEALNAETSQLFFGVDHIRGMLIESVEDGGAADQAGIQPGDVITRIEDTVIIDGQNTMQEFANRKPGETITVQVYRNGQTFNLPTTLGFGFGQAIVIEP